MTYIFPSTLIVSATNPQDQIDQFCSQLGHRFHPSNPDLKIIDSDWSIENIRSIKNFLSQKPYNHSTKIIIIENAQNLKTEAQNSLLKILEEPGKNNYLLLTTNQPHNLLPTIHSRCHLLKINDHPTTNHSQTLKISPNLKNNLAIVDQLGLDKNTAIPFLENQISLFRHQLIAQPSQKTAHLIYQLIRATQMIKANVDAKSALDYFFLSQ